MAPSTPLRDSVERWIAAGQPADFDWPPPPEPPPPDLYSELTPDEAAALADALATAVQPLDTAPRPRRRRRRTKDQP